MPHQLPHRHPMSRQVAAAGENSDDTDPSTIHHVGIYIGQGKMVEAPYTGARVRISSIWRRELIGATRPAP